jgi:hypothetical protein
LDERFAKRRLSATRLPNNCQCFAALNIERHTGDGFNNLLASRFELYGEVFNGEENVAARPQVSLS